MSHNRAQSVVLALVATSAIAQSQSRIYVDADQLGMANGQSWSTAFRDIQDALALAPTLPAPVAIWIAEGVYRPDGGTADRTRTYDLKGGTSLFGGFQGSETSLGERNIPAHPTVLDGDLLANDGPGFANFGDNTIHIVSCIDEGGLIELDGLILRHGNANGSPVGFFGRGALYARNCTISVTNCEFRENLRGGTCLNQGCNAVFRSCAFLANEADEGSALFSHRNSIQLLDCLFDGNRAIGSDAGAVRTNSISSSEQTTIRRCVFVNNSAHWRGGGLFLFQDFVGTPGSALIEDCLFDSNEAGEGGGACLFAASPSFLNIVTIRRTKFCANLANNPNATGDRTGGALDVEKTGLTMSDCLFTNNRSLANGGAIKDSTSDRVRVSNCRFFNNVSELEYGGAWANHSSPHTQVSNCVFAGNAAQHGGAMFLGSVSPIDHASISSCTLVGNTAGDCGGLWQGDSLTRIANSILWGNADSTGTSQGAQIRGPIIITSCDVQGWDGSLGGVGNFAADPLLVSALGCDGSAGTLDDNLRLLPGSPCQDVGSVADISADFADLDADGNLGEPTPFDLDRLARLSGSGVDLGAYESQGQLPQVYCTGKLNSLGCLPRICAIGRPTFNGVDDFALVGYDVLSHRNGLMIWGLNATNQPFGGGTLCVRSPMYRVPVANSGGTPAIDDCSGEYHGRFEQAFVNAVGLPAGAHVFVQFLSRDPGFAPPSNYGLTDAVEFELTP